MNSVVYASTTSSGPLAPYIGWINFGQNFNLTPGGTAQTITNTIPGGYTVTFNISLTATSTPTIPSYPALTAVVPPTFTNAPFGGVQYTGITGNTSLYLATNPMINYSVTYNMQINSITVTDRCGIPIDDYIFYVADSETTTLGSTNVPEVWTVTTNGSPFEILSHIPAYNNSTAGPIVTGTGTTSITETGTASTQADTSSYVYTTYAPTQLLASFTTDGGNQSFTFGIVVPNTRHTSRLNTSAVTCAIVNRSSDQSMTTYCLPCSRRETLSDVQYGDVMYEATDFPLYIMGSLGTYLITEESITLFPNPIASTDGTDILIFYTTCGTETNAYYAIFQQDQTVT